MLKKMSLKFAILIPVIIIIIIGTIAVNGITFWQSALITTDLSYQLMEETANRYANLIKAEEETAYALATATAPLMIHMRDNQTTRAQVVEALKDILESHENIVGIWTAWEPDAFDAKDSLYKNRDYHDSSGRFIPYLYKDNDTVYIEALNGYDVESPDNYYTGTIMADAIHYTPPHQYETATGTKNLYSVSVPIKEGDKVIGVMGVDIDLDKFNERMNSVVVFEEGFLFTINPNGYVMSHPLEERRYKFYTDAKSASYNYDIETLIKEGGSRIVSDYSKTLQSTTMMYFQAIQIGEAENYWVICATAPLAVINGPSRNMAMLSTIVGVAVVLIVGLAVFIIVKQNFQELPVLIDAAKNLSEGKIIKIRQSLGAPSNTKNEVTLLRHAFSHMVDTLEEQVFVVQKIARGDLSVEIEPKSTQDLLNVALYELLDAHNEVFYNFQRSAGVIRSSAQQIASGAQILAQGATEQSSFLSELAFSAQEVTQKAGDNEELAIEAAQLTTEVHTIAGDGSKKLQELIAAVKDIDRSSQNISTIIKLIDDIAFQTNILAINASIEAARAGEMGRGFAVVASEIRELAGKSSAAASETESMIRDTIKKAHAGTEIAIQTNEILSKIIKKINISTDIVNQIPPASQKQTQETELIQEGLRQVSETTRANSAASEESAATSEELSEQAAILYAQLEQFQLKDSSKSK